jgi:Na+/melibiose symporter-like transporter
MSTITASVETRSSSKSLSTAFSVGAVLAIIGSLGFISLNGLSPREAYAHPVGIVTCILSAIGCLVLAFALMRWRTTLPGWAVVTSAAGVFIAAANAYAQGTVIVAAATNTDNELFNKLFFESPWTLGSMAPKSLLCLVGFLALAIAGWRQRSIPRFAAALLGIAGIVSIWPPYPPGIILASIALFLISRGPLEARS